MKNGVDARRRQKLQILQIARHLGSRLVGLSVHIEQLAMINKSLGMVSTTKSTCNASGFQEHSGRVLLLQSVQ